MMIRRETLEEFNIYRETVERRRKVDAENFGMRKYREMARLLGKYSAASEQLIEEVARGEAREAETQHLSDWNKGKYRYPFGLGVGVRALIRPGRQDLLARTFVPEPPQLGAPEIVEVEVPDADELLTGLILPNGTFEYGSNLSSGSKMITFFAETRPTHDGGPIFGSPTGPAQSLSPHLVVSVSDAGGAYWEPSAIRYERNEVRVNF